MSMKKRLTLIGSTVAIIALLLFIQSTLLTPTPQKGYAMTPNEGKTVVSSGVGEISVKPDTATITVGAQSKNAVAEKAQKEVNDTIKKLKEVLTANKVDSKNIQTAYFQVYPFVEYQNDQKGKDMYQAEHMLEVKYDNLEKLGSLLDALSKAGANNIGHIEFGLKDQAEAEHEALHLAIKRAEAKADVMATTVGKKRGDVIHVADQQSQIDTVMRSPGNAEYAQEASDHSGNVNIEAGEIKVRQTVDVIYELK